MKQLRFRLFSPAPWWGHVRLRTHGVHISRPAVYAASALVLIFTPLFVRFHKVCMARHNDWRQCQPPLQAFKSCMDTYIAAKKNQGVAGNRQS